MYVHREESIQYYIWCLARGGCETVYIGVCYYIVRFIGFGVLRLFSIIIVVHCSYELITFDQIGSPNLPLTGCAIYCLKYALTESFNKVEPSVSLDYSLKQFKCFSKLWSR